MLKHICAVAMSPYTSSLVGVCFMVMSWIDAHHMLLGHLRLIIALAVSRLIFNNQHKPKTVIQPKRTTSKQSTQTQPITSTTTITMSDSNRQGGSIYDMAEDGTKVPEDATKPNLIPSKARPDQTNAEDTAGGLGASKLHMAADNATATTGFGETVSASGGELPDDIGQKYSRSGGKRGQESASHGGRNHPTHGS